MCIYLFWDRAWAGEGQRERERERIPSSPPEPRSYDPENTTWANIKCLAFNRLSHQRAPIHFFNKIVSTVSDRWTISTFGDLIYTEVGPLGGSVGSASDFSSGHELTVLEFKPCPTAVCSDSSEPGACFWLCLPLSLFLSGSHSVSFSFSLKSK